MKKLTREEMKNLIGGKLAPGGGGGGGSENCTTDADCGYKDLVCNGNTVNVHGHCSPQCVCRYATGC